MTFPQKPARSSAFTLVEMVAVIAIVIILLTAGVAVLGNTGPQARRTATDQLMGMIEQARSSAITSRSTVILAIAEPGDLPENDGRCRLALFRVKGDWKPNESPNPPEVTLISRWRPIEQGAILWSGMVNGAENPLGNEESSPSSGTQVTISYKTNNNYNVEAHVLAFNSRGSLLLPEGSDPIGMRIAEGGYRDGKASPNKRAGTEEISENTIQIGRVTARPYRIN